MAWGRIVRLEARNSEGVQVDVSALRIDARCVRSRVFANNELEATIYNANESTINKFLQRGTNVALYAGYEDEGTPGLMYQGNIIDSKTYRQGADTLTVVRSMALRSLSRPFTATPVCLAFEPGKTAADVIDSIGAILGLVPVGKEMAAEVEFEGGWTYVGPVSGAMKRLGQDLRPAGIGLYVDLAELVVFKYSGDSTYTMAFISQETGLLSLQNTTDYISAAHSNLDSLASKLASYNQAVAEAKSSKKKILKPDDPDDVYAYLDGIFKNMKKTYSARTVVMPKLRPNSLVHLSDKSQGVDGLFVVDQMEVAVGNGRDSSFAMDLNLVEA
jgi:hypothetical protein